LVELEYALDDEGSDFDVDHVEIVEALPPPVARTTWWRDRPLPVFAWVVGFLLITLLTIAILALRG
ncbi:MAG TPA: hypothetical protein VFQ39_08400, partial [Longimicrobium sp.]|nr:hypothetical protein [Longimicrobium sp.]